MKKFLSIMLVVCGLFSFAACDDETKNPYSVDTTISIVSADMFFPATASVGSIHYVSTNGAVTATSRASWCKAQVSGDSVIVTVDANPGLSGRSTVVELKNASGSIEVAMTQRGVDLSSSATTISIGNEGGVKSAQVVSSVGVQLLSSPEWVATSLVDDTLFVNFSENNSGHLRNGYITYQAGGVEDSIRLVQADFNTDIAGEYTLCYLDGLDGEESTFSAVLTEDELQITDYRLNIPITFNPETMEIEALSGSYIGRSSGRYLYLIFGADEGTYWTNYVEGIAMSAKFVYDDVEGTVADFSGLLNMGDGIPEANMDCFMIQKFTRNELNSEYDDGTMMMLYYPRLQRVPASASANVLR